MAKRILYNIDYNEPYNYTTRPRESAIVSGSLSGMYKHNDLLPNTSTLVLNISGSRLLVDKTYTPAFLKLSSGSNYSIGIDLGAPRSIYGLLMYDYDNGFVGPGITWSGSNCIYVVYKSANNLNWELVDIYYPPDRQLFSGSIYKTSFLFGDSASIGSRHNARYFKINAPSGSVTSAMGRYLRVSEIRALEIPSDLALTFSGSRFNGPSITINKRYTPSGSPIKTGGKVNPAIQSPGNSGNFS